MRLVVVLFFLFISLSGFSQQEDVRFVSTHISENMEVQVILAPLDNDTLHKALDLSTDDIPQKDKDRVVKFFGVDFNEKKYGANGEEKASDAERKAITNELIEKFRAADIPQLPAPEFKFNDFLDLGEQDMKIIEELKLTTEFQEKIKAIKKGGKRRLATVRFLVSGGFTFVGTFVGADVVEFTNLLGVLDNPETISQSIKFASDPAVIKAALAKALGFGFFAGAAGAVTTYFWNEISEHYLQGNFIEDKLKKMANFFKSNRPKEESSEEFAKELSQEIEKLTISKTKDPKIQSETSKLLRQVFTSSPSTEGAVKKVGKFFSLEGFIGGLYMAVARGLGISSGPIGQAIEKEIRNTILTLYTQGDLNITVSNITASKVNEVKELQEKIRNTDIHVRHQFVLVEQLDDLIVYYKNKETIKALNASALFAVNNTAVRFGAEKAFYGGHLLMKAYAFSQNWRERVKKIRVNAPKILTFPKYLKEFIEDFSWALLEDTARFNKWAKSTRPAKAISRAGEKIDSSLANIYEGSISRSRTQVPSKQTCSSLFAEFTSLAL